MQIMLFCGLHFNINALKTNINKISVLFSEASLKRQLSLITAKKYKTELIGNKKYIFIYNIWRDAIAEAVFGPNYPCNAVKKTRKAGETTLPDRSDLSFFPIFL